MIDILGWAFAGLLILTVIASAVTVAAVALFDRRKDRRT